MPSASGSDADFLDLVDAPAFGCRLAGPLGETLSEFLDSGVELIGKRLATEVSCAPSPERAQLGFSIAAVDIKAAEHHGLVESGH